MTSYKTKTIKIFFHIVAAGASIGAVFGFLSACRDIFLNGYFSLGYWRNISFVLRNTMTGWTLIGAVISVALILLRFSLKKVSIITVLTKLTLKPLRLSHAAVFLAASVLLMVLVFFVLFVLYGRPEPRFLGAILAVTLIGFGLAVSIAHFLSRRFIPDSINYRTFLYGFYAMTSIFLSGSMIALYPNWRNPMQSESVTAIISLAIGSFFTFFIVRAVFFNLINLTNLSRSLLLKRYILSPYILPLILFVGFQLLFPFLSRPTLSTKTSKNIVLIGIDTLRLDHTSLFRTDQRGLQLTPNLTRLSKSGASFRHAISQAPWTMPAFASVMTGRYPQEHRAISQGGFLRKKESTLAEVLKEAGYYNSAVISAPMLNERHGFSQGFDEFDQSNILGRAAITSKKVTDKALNTIKENKDGPFFLFVHYFDPHYDYMQQPDWDFADHYTGWLSKNRITINELREKRRLLGPDDIEYLLDLYDEEIAYTDREIGRLLAFLEKEGLMEETAVVVVADHGEEFMERGWIGHTVSLFNELIRVPLIMHLPGVSSTGTVIDTVVETRSVFGTILDYLGIRKGEKTESDSLVPLLTETAEHNKDKESSYGFAFSSTWLPDAHGEKRVRKLSVHMNEWKLIFDYDNNSSLLYDLSKDPYETRNLASEEPEKRAELWKLLDSWHKMVEASGAETPALNLSEEEVRKLKSLGYL